MKQLVLLLCLISQFNYAQSSEEKDLIIQAEQFQQKGDLENAIKTSKEIMKLNPKSYEAANSIAGYYGLMGKFNDEIIWAEKSVTINPKFCPGYINLGNGYVGNGDYEKATLYFRKAKEADPASPFPPYSLGVMEENKENFQSAITYYEESVKLDKNFENGYYNLAAMYALTKDFEKANKNIQKVLELNPNAEDAKEMQQHILQEINQKQ